MGWYRVQDLMESGVLSDERDYQDLRELDISVSYLTNFGTYCLGSWILHCPIEEKFVV